MLRSQTARFATVERSLARGGVPSVVFVSTQPLGGLRRPSPTSRLASLAKLLLLRLALGPNLSPARLRCSDKSAANSCTHFLSRQTGRGAGRAGPGGQGRARTNRAGRAVRGGAGRGRAGRAGRAGGSGPGRAARAGPAAAAPSPARTLPSPAERALQGPTEPCQAQLSLAKPSRALPSPAEPCQALPRPLRVTVGHGEAR